MKMTEKYKYQQKLNIYPLNELKLKLTKSNDYDEND